LQTKAFFLEYHTPKNLCRGGGKSQKAKNIIGNEKNYGNHPRVPAKIGEKKKGQKMRGTFKKRELVDVSHQKICGVSCG